MTAASFAKRVVRLLTDDPQAFAGQHIEFTDKELKFLGPIVAIDMIRKSDGTLEGIAIQTSWMVEAEADSPTWSHAKRSRRHEVCISAEDLDTLTCTEEDDQLHLVFRDGSTVVIMPEGDHVSIEDITDHGY